MLYTSTFRTFQVSDESNINMFNVTSSSEFCLARYDKNNKHQASMTLGAAVKSVQ